MISIEAPIGSSCMQVIVNSYLEYEKMLSATIGLTIFVVHIP